MGRFLWIVNSLGEPMGKLCLDERQGTYLTPSHFDGLGLTTEAPDFEITPDGIAEICLPLLGGVSLVSCEAEAPFCPKRALREQTSRLLDCGYDLQVGLELEFYLEPENLERERLPAGQHAYQLSPIFRQESFHRECVEHLRGMPVPSVSLHAEGGDGQFEISFGPTDPRTAAATLVVVKLLIQQAAQAHDLALNLSPKPVAGQFGNGLHLNFSLRSQSSGIVDQNASRRFALGVASYARDLQLIYCPSETSYARLSDDLLKRNWLNFDRAISDGTRNGLIRFVSRDGRHEFRLPDTSANIFSALAAMIASGMAGLKIEDAGDAGAAQVRLNMSLAESNITFDTADLTALELSSLSIDGLAGRLRQLSAGPEGEGRA